MKDHHELLRAADQAVYLAKTAQKSCLRFWCAELVE